MGLAHELESATDVRLTLTTLGAAELSRACGGGPAEPVLGPGKPLALVVYLALSPRRTASREHLIGLLWSDSEPDRAYHALRQTVWHIRRQVGERVLLTRNGDIELAAPVMTDRDAFIAAVNVGDDESAVSRYIGEFLPGLATPGGAAFEQWAELERIRLRTAFLRSAESLARRCLGEGHMRDAQRLARRARDADRLNESGWRLLLETLIAGDDWTAAAMEADALSHLLEDEELEPEPATRAAIRRAHQMPAVDEEVERRGLGAELVGREREFATIVEAWAEVRQGRARHVHVVAPAGLGKTRLLKDTMARLRAGGTRAVYLRAHSGERAIPFAHAADLAAVLSELPGAAAVSPGTATTLVTLNPSLTSRYPMRPDSGVNGEALRHRIVALAELLGAVADETPMAVLLDDLHWADPDSRRVITALASRLDGRRVLLVSATRPSESVKPDGTEATTLHLGPLSERLVAELVGSIATLPDAPWARELPARLTAASNGSPLLVLESLQHALESGILTLVDGSWSCAAPAALAQSLEAGSALQRRLSEQDPVSRILLLTLAVAGTPLSLAMVARATQRPEDTVEPLLVTLEERGLVSRAGSTWEIAHDEAAGLLLDRTAEGIVEVARRSLGKALALDAGTDPVVTRQAAHLLASAGEDAVLAQLYRDWLSRKRAQGDQRGPRDLVKELLGDAARPEQVRTLVASLPLAIRLGLDSGRRRLLIGAPVAAAGLAALALLMRPDAPPPDAAVFAFARTPEGYAAWRAELRRNEWRNDIPVPLAPARSALAPLVWAGSALPARAPDGDSWVAEVSTDSSAIDLVQLFDDGRPAVPLAYSPADEGAPSWAPDGSAIVYTTGKWDPLSRPHVAILDLRTGSERQLTDGDAGDGYPRWSPDGTRIAFGRRRYDGGPGALCVIAQDGSALRCLPVASRDEPVPLGWRDADRVVLQWDDGGKDVRDVVDLGSGARTPLPGAVGGSASLSPDGAWLLWHDRERVNGPVRWYAFSLDDDRDRRVVGGEELANAQLVWDVVPGTPSYLDTLRLVPVTEPIPLTAGRKLAVEGVDPTGRPVPPQAVTWRSADPTVASVDSAGVLLPRRAGRVWIHASAGGWRADSVPIEIAEAVADTVLAESWRDGLNDNWVPFGEPRPEIVALGDSAAFWTRGDSSFTSGVYSRRTFSAAAGLGVEVLVAGRVTRTQWQLHSLELLDIDAATLETWDHRTGGVPRRNAVLCSVTYPAREGPGGADSVRLGCSTVHLTVPAPPSLGEGRWHRLRMQLLPDGRLGLAIDGVPVGRTPTPIPLDREFRLVINGYSHDTQMLTGDLALWTGVPDDVDWRVLDGLPEPRE
jgi:DNA-binding SARP family transcriptional activator